MLFDLLLVISLAVAVAGAVGYIYACVDLTRPAANGTDHQP
jgi:hypothetical protein